MLKRIIILICIYTNFINCSFGQCASKNGKSPEYLVRKYEFNDIIWDMYLAPNFGLFVSNGTKLKLFDGRKIEVINHLASNDSNGSGTVYNFYRAPRYSIYYQTSNYIYKLSSKLDTIPFLHSQRHKYFLTYPKFNTLERKKNTITFPEKRDLAELIFKKKSGLIIGKTHIAYFNFKSNTLKGINEFPKNEILFYINFGNSWFIYTENETYQVSLLNSGQVKTEIIKDPLPILRSGRVFLRNNEYFLINGNGLFKINFINGELLLNCLINGKKDYIPSGAFHFEISEDHNDIYFSETNSTNILHYRKYKSCSIKMSSLNSIFVTKNKIFTNNFKCYNYETDTLTTDSLLGNYANDYYAIGNNTYLTNFKGNFISYFDENLTLKPFANIEGFFITRFANYKGKIYFTIRDKMYYYSDGKVVFVPYNKQGSDIDFSFSYSLLVKNNQLYLGTDKGLLIYDFVSGIIKKQSGIVVEEIRNLIAPNNGKSIIAFSYGKGPYIIENNKARRLPLDQEKNLLFAHNLVIKDSLAYISSNNGIYVIPFTNWISASPKSLLRFYKLDSLDGLPVNECNSGTSHSMVIDSIRNNILVATVKGIGIIPLNQTNLSWPNVAPKVISTNYSNLSFVGCKSTIADYTNLEFKVSSPYFGNPINLIVEYKVNGVFDTWSQLKDGSIFMPDNLYGEYKIELRMVNGFDSYIFNHYYIYLEPKWHQTFWFKFLVTILILIVLFLLLWLFKRNESKKREKIQLLVDKRTIELNNALAKVNSINSELTKSESIKENLVSVLAHDLRSPLMSILYTLDFLIKSEENENSGSEKLEILIGVKSSISQIAQFSSEFLKWYSANNAGFKLVVTNQHLNELILPVVSIYEPIIKEAGNKISTILNRNIFIGVDKELFKIVFRNLIDNANKYCGGDIIVESFYEENLPVLLVKNNINPKSEFDFNSIKRRLEVGDGMENQTFKFGLTLIGKMAKVSNLDLSVSFENGWLTFTIKFIYKT